MIADLHSELAVREASKRETPSAVLNALVDPLGSSNKTDMRPRPDESGSDSISESVGYRSKEVHRTSQDSDAHQPSRGVDTIGLAWDEEADRGGAANDSASVDISVLTEQLAPNAEELGELLELKSRLAGLVAACQGGKQGLCR